MCVPEKWNRRNMGTYKIILRRESSDTSKRRARLTRLLSNSLTNSAVFSIDSAMWKSTLAEPVDFYEWKPARIVSQNQHEVSIIFCFFLHRMRPEATIYDDDKLKFLCDFAVSFSQTLYYVRWQREIRYSEREAVGAGTPKKKTRNGK